MKRTLASLVSLRSTKSKGLTVMLVPTVVPVGFDDTVVKANGQHGKEIDELDIGDFNIASTVPAPAMYALPP